MIHSVYNEKFGNIEVEESIWSGKITAITINGVPMIKVDKKIFMMETSTSKIEAGVVGNFFTGLKLMINRSELIQIVPPLKWYEIALTIISALFCIIWGNVPQLVKLVPLVGGAIGGALTGIFEISGLALMRKFKNPLLKFAIWLAALILSFGSCALVGWAIISSVN